MAKKKVQDQSTANPDFFYEAIKQKGNER